MRGSIRRRSTKSGEARFEALVDAGRDPATGKRRQLSRTFERERDAWRWVRTEIKALEADKHVERRDITLGAYLTNEWLPVVTPSLKPSTADSYRRTVELHIVPHIGALPLQQVRAAEVAKFASTLAATKRRNRPGGTLAPKYVTNIFRILSKALADAVELKYIPVNPCEAKAAKPRVRAVRVGAKVKAWDEQQLRAFLDAMRERLHWSAWHVAAYTGMRRGELLGLRWADVDFPHACLHVRETVVLAGGKSVEQEDGKTENAPRTIDLDPKTVAVLRAHRKRQAKLLLALGVGQSEYVFCGRDGVHLNPDSFSQAFDRGVAAVKGEVVKLSLQGLRHTHATILLKAGVPVKVVSERLGHASVAFTMMQYQHILPGMQASAAATFATAVDQAEPAGEDEPDETAGEDEADGAAGGVP